MFLCESTNEIMKGYNKFLIGWHKISKGRDNYEAALNSWSNHEPRYYIKGIQNSSLNGGELSKPRSEIFTVCKTMHQKLEGGRQSTGNCKETPLNWRNFQDGEFIWQSNRWQGKSQKSSKEMWY